MEFSKETANVSTVFSKSPPGHASKDTRTTVLQGSAFWGLKCLQIPGVHMYIYMQCTYSTCMHALVYNINSVGLRCILCACNRITLLGVVVCEHVCLCAHTGIYGHLKSHCRPAIYGIIWSMSWFGEYSRLSYGLVRKFHWIRIHRIHTLRWNVPAHSGNIRTCTYANCMYGLRDCDVFRESCVLRNYILYWL